MSFNEEELIKIENATSGWFKKSARAAISQAIAALRPNIENAQQLPEEQRNTALKQLIIEATAARHRALQKGANSYGHPEWAAAAACESWLHELVGGTADSIACIEAIIDKLERRIAVNEVKEKSDWPALLLLLVVLPLAFTFGGVWIGVIVLVVGVIALGWRKRHEGPFPTNKQD